MEEVELVKKLELVKNEVSMKVKMVKMEGVGGFSEWPSFSGCFFLELR